MRVPADPSDISTAWLAAALHRAPAFRGAEIVRADATRIGEGYGLDGVVARLALETRGAQAPRTIVAKLARAERGTTEIEFYERIAARMPVRLPEFFAGYVDGVEDRAILLLEDLSHAVQGDAVRGASRLQAEAALRAIAAFQVAFVGADEETLPLPAWEERGATLAQRVSERGERFLERYGETFDPRARAHVAVLPDRLPEAAGVLGASPPTLVHSDLHMDNVLFLPGHRPVILDWTHACRGPALIDVVRVFVEGMTVEMRRRYGDSLLEEYLRARAEIGYPPVARERIDEEAHAAVLWHLAYAITWAGAENPGFGEPRVRAIVDSLVRNTIAAASDLL